MAAIDSRGAVQMKRLIFGIAAVLTAGVLMGGAAFGATLLFPYMNHWAGDPSLRFVPEVMVAVSSMLLGVAALRRKYRVDTETAREQQSPFRL
jgi:hypothetical protein